MDYEDDIIQWSGYPRNASLGPLETIDASTIREKASQVRERLMHIL